MKIKHSPTLSIFYQSLIRLLQIRKLGRENWAEFNCPCGNFCQAIRIQLRVWEFLSKPMCVVLIQLPFSGHQLSQQDKVAKAG